MEIIIDRIEGEMRDGYYVQPMVKRLWTVQLDILKEIDTICKRHNIKYVGWFGTMLGAVRHHGFIPWDDDMDLAMLREDFERFLHYARTELPKGWVISEEYPASVAVFHTDTIRLDQEFLDKYHGCPLITGIDIFCMDDLPCSKEEETLQLNLLEATFGLCTNWELPEDDPQWEGSNRWTRLEEIEELTGQQFDRQQPIKKQLRFLADRIAAMYWDTGSEEVARMPRLCVDPAYHFPKSFFDRIIHLPFENTMIPVLADYDVICRLDYGDEYMTPLKINPHDYLKKQIPALKKFFETLGTPFPECFELTFD